MPGTKITPFYETKWDTLKAFLELQNVDILWVLSDLSKTRVFFSSDSNGPKIVFLCVKISIILILFVTKI